MNCEDCYFFDDDKNNCLYNGMPVSGEACEDAVSIFDIADIAVDLEKPETITHFKWWLKGNSDNGRIKTHKE